MFEISQRVLDKLAGKTPPVTTKEVQECFENLRGSFLEDTREVHRTDPPSQWFVAETNHRRLLKVVFMFKDQTFVIKSAFEPNDQEIALYDRLAY